MNNDTWETAISYNDENYAEYIYTGMYFYLLKEGDTRATSVLGNCNAINSLVWSPILDESKLKTIDVNYDVERFGKIQGTTLDSKPTLHRITGVINGNYELGRVPLPLRENTGDFLRSYKNESRLLNYPYKYGMVCDYINAPVEVQFHLCPVMDDKTVRIHAKGFISDKCTYSVYIENYKRDYYGNMEGSINSAPLDMPVSSSAYAQYSSTQKAQVQNNTNNAIMNSKLGVAQNTIGALGGINLMNPLSALSSGASIGMGIYRGQVEQAQAIGNKSALEKDLLNTPRSMINTGSDIGFSMMNGRGNIDFITYGLTEEYLNRLGDYFALYGYKQNKLMVVNYRNRYYYNYVKTIGANIVPKYNAIPKEHLQELINIFDSGVTIWHMDREGVEMFDYTYDNREV